MSIELCLFFEQRQARALDTPRRVVTYAAVNLPRL